MFDYAESGNEMNELIKEYVSAAYENSSNSEPAFNYMMGKGWPEFTLESLEKATGLDGEEYGFNPNKINMDFLGKAIIKAKMPDLESSSKADTGSEDKRYSSAGTSVSNTPIRYENDYLENDMHHMRTLSDEIIDKLRLSVNETLNEFDYEGSPLLSNALERSFLSLLVDMAMDKASGIAEVRGILHEDKSNPWSKYHLLRCAFENVILIEIFGCRRPNYRRVMG